MGYKLFTISAYLWGFQNLIVICKVNELKLSVWKKLLDLKTRDFVETPSFCVGYF